MNQSDTSEAPLVVLCSRRSGASVFMELLETAGLALGELAPSATDDPRGFFENQAAVQMNEHILEAADRDWTCPPPQLARSSYAEGTPFDRKSLLEPMRPLINSDRAWGFKDPRTLFTLPAWASALGSVRLVGVHRNAKDIASSLTERYDFAPHDAMTIALAYSDRLAAVHRILQFPVVSFDSEPDEFLARTAKIAELMGLDWHHDKVDAIFDRSLVHHRSMSKEATEIDGYLSEVSRRSVNTLNQYTAATVTATCEGLSTEWTRSCPTHLGPRYLEERTGMVSDALRRLPNIGTVAVLDSDERKCTTSGVETTNVTVADLLGGAVTAGPFSHLVGPRVLDEVAPPTLARFISRLVDQLDDNAVVEIGGWVIDGENIPPSRRFEPSDIVAHRRDTPHLHHIDEITTALLSTPFVLLEWRQTEGGRSQLVITSGHRPNLQPASLRMQLERERSRAENSPNEHQNLVDRLANGGCEQQDLTDTAPSAVEQLKADHAKLTESLAAERNQLAQTERERTEAMRSLESVKAQLTQARNQIETTEAAKRELENSLTVRVVLRIVRLADPLVRIVRRARSQSVNSDKSMVAASKSRAGPRRTVRQVVNGIISSRSDSASSGPLVSIAILTRNGAHHIRRLLRALERTTYRSFEVIIVDNGSCDDTSAVVRHADWSFPVRVITNDFNASFAAGNNAAVDAACGMYVLFLNNDVEPINPGWLGNMVAEFESDSGIVGAGAILIYPKRGDDTTDLTVQHTGIGLRLRDGAAHAVNLPAVDPLDPHLRRTRVVQAVTAAALMVTKDAFATVGGFDTGYIYGTEDVDLCLKLAHRGRLVVVGGAALFHHESATQNETRSELNRINRIGNWQLFAERWGPIVKRTVHNDLLSLDSCSRTVAITITRDDISAGWGDYYTAHELGEAFSNHGWNVVYAERYQDRWYNLDDGVDVIISLLDAYDVRRAPSNAFTIAWVRNWVDRWTAHPWFETFDLVLASSIKAAERIASITRHSPDVIPLATNPDRFCPGPPVPTFESDFVFTGNNWGDGRELIQLLDVRPGERFKVFGKGWDNEARISRYWRGHLSYDLLPDLYRSTKIVLDDTARHTLPYAFVNGRVFDALASGALVLTNNQEGSEELFDGLLPVYRDGAELRSLLDKYLANDDARNQLVNTLRDRVLSRHTYASVPARILESARASNSQPTLAFKIDAPSDEQIEQCRDTQFVEGMARALGKSGFRTEVHILPEWDLPNRQNCDVVVHLRGLTKYTPKPAHLDVLWIISHRDDVAVEECEKYDLVLVASRVHADYLRSRMDTPVFFMPQATDGERFSPEPPAENLATEVLFVDSGRGRKSQAVNWAMERELPLTIYNIEPDCSSLANKIRSNHSTNDQLAARYGSAGVVLTDHSPDMRRWGFVSNRIFDILAAGGVVVSDPVAGLEGLFGDLVPTYSSAEELETIVKHLLSNPGRREAISSEACKLVHAKHTFDKRAKELADVILPLLRSQSRNFPGLSLGGNTGAAN